MSSRTVLLIVAAGVVGWFVAALFIRFTAHLGWYGGGLANIILFAASAPVALALAELVRRLAPKGQSSVAAALLVTPALLLDGLALTWTPGLYGNAAGGPHNGSTWLLYGVGLILAAALWRDLSGRRA
jgi:hypothetical protein